MGKYATGIKNFYVAKQLTDTAGVGATYDTPVKLSEAVSASVEPNVATGRLPGDNRIVATASKFNYATVNITSTSLTAQDEVLVFGKTLGADGVLKSKGEIPYVAFGFEVTFNDASSEFWWLLKGKFQEPSHSKNTQGDSIEFSQPSISGEFIPRDFDEEWKFVGNEGNTGFETITADNWFNAVYEPNPDTTAPTITVSPLDAATGVAATTTIEWTFSEEIKQEDVHDGNFYLMDVSGNEVMGVLSTNVGNMIVTLTPDASLSATTDYTAVASKNVRDLGGNNLASTEITNFTTI
jgi:phi13 family phage major tail protein